MAGMKPFLGIDIGGTNIKLATVSPTARVVERGLVETRASEGAARAFARIHAAARTLGPNGIAGVGIGCAGLFDERRGVLTASPNLKAWQGTKLTALAAKHFSVPILIQNDATVAAYGESVVRGPRGRNLVLIDGVAHPRIQAHINNCSHLDQRVRRLFNAFFRDVKINVAATKEYRSAFE